MPMFRNGRSFAIQSSCLSVPRTSRSIQLCRIHIPPNPRIPLCKKHKEPCLKKFSGNSLERAAAGYWICSRQHPCDTFIWNNTESISTEINLDFKAAEANLTMHPKLHLYFEALSEHSTIIRGNFTKSAFFLAFKKDQTIEYCSRKSGWVVPWNVKDRLVEKLAQDEVEFRNTYIVDIPQICRFYFSYSRNLSSRSGKTIDKWLQDEETFDVSRIPIWDRLLEFQRQGVQFCVKRHGRAIIADEMGLGKTIQAIAVALYFKEDWPLLIVAPSSLLLNWNRELCEFLPEELSRNIKVISRSKDIASADLKSPTNIVIISYSLTKHIAKLGPIFKMIILDESHYIKTIDSQRSKAVTEIAKRACRVLCLSGTPILSKPIELWTQLNILNPGAFMTYHLFGLRYCNASRSRFYPFWDYSGSSNLRELNWILNRYFLIRRSKSSVLSQLPKKTRQQINIDTKLNKDMINLRRSATFLKEYILRRVGIESSEDAGEIKDKTEIDEDTSTIDQSKLTIVNRLYHASGLCKIPGVQDFIADLIDSGDKFLLFGHHVDFLDSMEEFLKSRKVSYIRIDGQSSVTARQASVEEFQSNESCQVALLSVTAAGVGITLTAANKVVFGELYWTPATLIQAEDRVHRIGQSNAVNVYYILGNGTIDDDIWPVIRKKFAVVSNVLDGRVISTFPGKSKKQNPLI